MIDDRTPALPPHEASSLSRSLEKTERVGAAPSCLRQNLHNHTTFSDGRFTMDQLIEEAYLAKIQWLGFSDHFYTPKVFRGESMGQWMHRRWPTYLQTIAATRSHRGKDMELWFGLEVDTAFDRLGAGMAGLPWLEWRQLDYLLIEYVGEPERGGQPLADLPRWREFWSGPLIIAHPAIDRWAESLPLDQVFAMMRRYGIALELPCGSRNPWYWFQRDPAVLRRLRLTLGSDTHEHIEDVGAIDKVIHFVQDHGLAAQLADPETLRHDWRKDHD
jgi:hypothetical protein